MNLKLNKSSRFFSILITTVIYIVVFYVLSQIDIKKNNAAKKREVVIEFRKIEKENSEHKEFAIIEKVNKVKIVKEIPKRDLEEESAVIIKSENLEVLIDSNIISEEDSLETKLNWLDSLVVANPNLQMLKYASEDYIKNNPLLKTDSAKVAEGIKHFMQDYYKSKYPTPVYKFGDGSPGIAIDDIINIFKSDDVDYEKIKKYLKIGKYDKK